MSTNLDGSIAVLYGSKSNTLSWVWLSPKHGRESMANVAVDGYWVRDHFNHPEFDAVVEQAQEAWAQLRAGGDISGRATHHLVPPLHNDIAPLSELAAA